ncbi:hypothetical protein L1279_003792 [Planomicrobium sp. HSC-17F08]|nr:hypothetical protein [Planomicrobium sp. HSC-17F08]
MEPRKALEDLSVMAFFAIIGKSEATSRGWAPELDKEKRKRLFSSDRHKTIW